MKKKGFVAILCVYAALIAAFALSNIFGRDDMRFTMALPLFFLSMSCFVVGNGREFWLPLALMFSAVADLFGSYGMFLQQVAIFGLAHIALIVYFLRQAWLRPSLLIFCLVVAVAGTVLGVLIAPNVAVPVERYLVIGYIVLICLMCMSAILWSKGSKGWYVAAAVMFMVSDSLIGLTRFGVVQIPYGFAAIMVTYYAAQAMFGGAYLARFMRSRKFNPAIMA